MRTHRWIVGAVVLCTTLGCRTSWDWSQKPHLVPEKDDCKQYSVKESLEFYEHFLPPRGFYEIFAVPERHDQMTDPRRLPYSFVVIRVRDGRFEVTQNGPIIERIIGPVRGDEMTDLFSIFRRYASSPPAGFYCWQNDCRGKFSPAGDPDPRDPYGPDLPDHAAIKTPLGYSVVETRSQAYTLPDGGTGGAGFQGPGGDTCNFVPREGTVLTREFIERLRASADRVGKALDQIP